MLDVRGSASRISPAPVVVGCEVVLRGAATSRATWRARRGLRRSRIIGTGRSGERLRRRASAGIGDGRAPGRGRPTTVEPASWCGTGVARYGVEVRNDIDAACAAEIWRPSSSSTAPASSRGLQQASSRRRSSTPRCPARTGAGFPSCRSSSGTSSLRRHHGLQADLLDCHRAPGPVHADDPGGWRRRGRLGCFFGHAGRGRDGVLTEDGEYVRVPTVAVGLRRLRRGHTVTAVVATALGAGAGRRAAVLANHAAGIEESGRRRHGLARRAASHDPATPERVNGWEEAVRWS